MNAAEFIADSGFNTAIALLMNTPETASHYSNDDGYYYEEWSHNGWVKSVNNQWVDCKKGKDLICLSDLKRYTGAWELVQNFGGLNKALEMINNPICFGDANFEVEAQLRKAITLVEEVESLKEVC